MRIGKYERQSSYAPGHRLVGSSACIDVRIAAKRLAAAFCGAFLVCFALAVGAAESRGSALQVSGVQTEPPGSVSMLVTFPEWSNAEVPRFELKIGEATVAASDVKRLEQPPLSLVLCIDKSGSMTEAPLRAIKFGVQQLVQSPSPQVDIAMIAFGSNIRVLSGFGTNPLKQADLVQDIQLEGRDSKTTLYEALKAAIAQLKGRPGNKRIIVLTDGQDEGSFLTQQHVAKAAADAGIGIDVIGTGPAAPRGEASMQKLSATTRGTFVHVPSGTTVVPALEALVERARPKGAVFQVGFKYAPGSKPPLEEATLSLLAANGKAGASQRVQAPFVPAATGLDRHRMIMIGLAIAAVAAIILVLLVFRRRSSGVTTTTSSQDVDAAVVVVGANRAPAAARSTRIVRHTFPAPEPGRPCAVLKGRSGPIGNRSLPIEKPLFRIGAAEQSDLRLVEDDFVSSDHASIRYDSGSLYLADRGSRNGTYLNGTRLAQAQMSLSPGDQIRFGRSEVTVEAVGAGGPVQPQDRVDEGIVR